LSNNAGALSSFSQAPADTENLNDLVNMRSRHPLLGVGLALVCFSLAGCGPTQIQASQLANKCDTSGVAPERSAQILSRVYLDGTPSMAGYVASPSSAYLEALKQLQQALSTAWPQPQVNYFRFGETVFPMTSVTDPDPRLPGFYQGGQGLTTATIDTAIAASAQAEAKSKSQNQLTVIVTDLYQKAATIDPILKQLNQKYLGKDLAVGVVGVRSQFRGAVYDVGAANASFTYQGEHPVYILVLGKYGDVSHLVEQLRKNPALKAVSQATIFTSQPVQPIATFLPQDYPPDLKPLKQQASRPETLNNGKVMVKGLLKDDYKFESLKLTAKKPIALDYPLQYQLLPHALAVQTASPVTRSYTFDSQAKAFKDANLQKAVSFGVPNPWPNQPKAQPVEVKAQINPENLDPGVHLLVTDIGVSEFKDPPWWQAWSASEDSRDGSKTHNLSSFLTGLKTITEQRKPAIARLCYLVQK
jgi:hypothetical protein